MSGSVLSSGREMRQEVGEDSFRHQLVSETGGAASGRQQQRCGR